MSTSTADVTKTTVASTLNELMVAAAAREIRDAEIVFVGMRLPLIAFVVAKKTHAPNAIGLFENGVIRSTPSPELYSGAGRTRNGSLAGLGRRLRYRFAGAEVCGLAGALEATAAGARGLYHQPWQW